MDLGESAIQDALVYRVGFFEHKSRVWRGPRIGDGDWHAGAEGGRWRPCRRLIDYHRFTGNAGEAACALVEAGQHCQPENDPEMQASVAALLGCIGMTVKAAPPPRHFAEVTRIVTATTSRFAFVRPYRGKVVERRGTLIACDGTMENKRRYSDLLGRIVNEVTSRKH